MNGLLTSVREKLSFGQEISQQEAQELYVCTNLLELGQVAGEVRSNLRNHECTLITARRIRYSNVCRNRCSYCNKAKRPGEDGAYTRSVSEVVDLAGAAMSAGVNQLQLAGGASPNAELGYFLEMVSALRRAYPRVHIQGFAPAQLVNLSVMAHRSSEELLVELRDAGLDSILEDGADIFDPEIRQVLCRSKATGGQWLQVMREAHEIGLPGGASMLYGHFEGREEKVEHLCRLRDLQDETGSFAFFAPRAFRAENNILSVGSLVGGAEDLREFAVGRIVLSSFPHIRCYANDLGMKTTQIALHFGVDTVVVAIHDNEPILDYERAAEGLPNATQIAELIERAGFEVKPGSLDQRPVGF
jgi:aminodeoxyfutalosine synthase